METTEERLQRVWPEWEIVRQIGRGGYGVVYEAVRTDSKLTSRAAIKAISISQDSPEVTSLLSDGFTVDMTHTYIRNVVDGFINEIQMMETFKGTQNIVSVEDYKVAERSDEFGWDIFIRMELLTPLPKYVQQHYMSESDVAKLGVDICKALEMCASRGVIHRDIKPENIFVNDFGDFKLGDFGVARRLEGMTVNLSRKGTYSYVAPEVEHGKQYDSRADIYSLGLVLYRMLNRNMMPFLTTEQQLTNPVERVQASQRRLSGEKLPPPTDASQAMADIICKACAFEPEDRYQTATAMKKELIAIRGNAVAVKKTVPAAASNTVKTINLSGKSKSYQTGKILALTLSLAVVMVGGLVALALAVGRHNLPTVPVPSSQSGASSEEAPAESNASEEPASHSVVTSEASSEVLEDYDAEPASEAVTGSESGSSESVTSSEKAASEKAASEKAASEKAASEKAASEKAASDKAASEKAASEKAASEKAASEKAASEKAASEKAASEKAASEKAASEEAAAKAAAESEAAAEKAASEKAASEKAASEKAASEKAASEKAASEKAASEEAAAKAAAESEAAASAKAASASEATVAEEDPYDFIPVGSKGYQIVQAELAKYEGKIIDGPYTSQPTRREKKWYSKRWYIFDNGKQKEESDILRISKLADMSDEACYSLEYDKPSIDEQGNKREGAWLIVWEKTYDKNWNILTDEVKISEEEYENRLRKSQKA